VKFLSQRCKEREERQTQALQLVRESGGSETTPSGWTPGKTTLKPGPDLVGKVISPRFALHFIRSG